MTDDAPAAEDEAPAKGGKLPLILGVVGALLLGGAGFYSVYSGMLDPTALFGGGEKTASADHGGEAHADAGHGDAGHGDDGHGESAAPVAPGGLAFVPLDQILISLPPSSPARHLRFTSQLEVFPGKSDAVSALMPRILDVLNTYLRAVDIADLQEPSSADRLRAQMLRRVQVVTGQGMVRDLLITEFVLN